MKTTLHGVKRRCVLKGNPGRDYLIGKGRGTCGKHGAEMKMPAGEQIRWRGRDAVSAGFNGNGNVFRRFWRRRKRE